MKEMVDKYLVFVMTFVVLAGALYIFRANENIVNIIIGTFTGLIAAPVIYPKDK
jgi:hypothetical protein